ncbi:hypothetical protein Terro_2510 [Terriglobus roseus DSM 18391]|uniref:Uncharacterized protein n=1 Tax=Terriglobus roseus (strain DSM 18391 / NRRL B-41598 / KBS 63) TaxID=926566 RepID=I3ZHN8_TERRK|nr:hypothetical protein [Terriglobus roseus]AFL88416.1 hypothetical protein Terro_2146 [Terriglobus roseus DSM 18391]AFL88756.1 hypothetical protein Terro_2510 [Terriglobus roseus DSM 18391]
MRAPAPPFELSIGDLVLEGMTPGARQVCAAAFSAEFELIVLNRGTASFAKQDHSEWQLPTLTLPAHTGDQPRRVGRALAVALYEALHYAGEGR